MVFKYLILSLFFTLLVEKNSDLVANTVTVGLDLRTKLCKTNVSPIVPAIFLSSATYGNVALLILIDNYDSFTWNLWHFVSDLGAEVEIVRNDAASAEDIIALNPEGILCFARTGDPENAGMAMDLILAAKRVSYTTSGVCLGHQALAAAFGASIKRVDPPVHGKLSLVEKTHSNAVKSDILDLCPKCLSSYQVSFSSC